MASKQVLNLERSSNSVQSTISTHSDTICSAVAARFGEPLREPVSILLKGTCAWLAADTAAMVSADSAHADELVDDAGPRQRRDDAAEKLSRGLVTMRAKLGAHYGDDYLAALGFSGPVPNDTLALKALGEKVHDKLGSVPRPHEDPDFVFNLERQRGSLQPHLGELVNALKDVANETDQADATQLAKNKAMDTYDTTFEVAASLATALLLMAGLPELAGKVRPSRRRPGTTTELEDGGTPTG